ncbi:MAG: SRPBCC family protein [Deltaproteobacteria bacterium]|nr:MAG: SRPBCC family protein [Deltaproteobacteria bacterium]
MADIRKHLTECMICAVIVCIGLLGLVSFPIKAAEELPFSPEELARLERGKVVFSLVEARLSDTQQSSVLTGSVLIQHPPEVIWEVLEHPEREKEWIRYLKESTVVSEEWPTPSTRVTVTDYRFDFHVVEVYYSLVREYDYEARTIRAYLDKKRPHKYFVDIQAGWNFYPYQDGIIFQYYSDSKLTVNLPRFISRRLAKRQLAAGIATVRKRCHYIAEEMKGR